MPAIPPPEITDPRDQETWRKLARTYEEHCGDNSAEYEERTRSFQAVLQAMNQRLSEAPFDGAD